MRTIHLSVSSILLVTLLVVSSAIGGLLVSNEIQTGGYHEIWTFTSSNPFGGENTFQAMCSDENGTLFLIEDMMAYNATTYPRNYIAVNNNGDLLWRSGVLGYSQLAMGADGNLYYTDAVNRTEWDKQDYSLWARNLTSLSHDGQFRWSYHVTNWTISFCGAFSDGTVIATHQSWDLTDVVNELLCLSPSGQLKWIKTMSVSNGTTYLFAPRVMANDTLLLFGGYGNRSFEVGIDREGKELWNLTIRNSFASSYNDGHTIIYSATKNYINSTTAIIHLDAFDTRNGSFAWSVLLRTTGNPQNYSNASEGWAAFVDGKGNIFAEDDDHKVHAFDSTGKALWTKELAGGYISTSDSGGMYLMNGQFLTRIDANGDVLWQYEIPSEEWHNSIFIGPNDSIYIIGPHSVVGLGNAGFSSNVVLLALLIIVDAAIVLGYFYRGNARR